MSKWLDRALCIAPIYYTLCLSEKDYHKACRHLGISKADRPEWVANWHSSATVHTFENRSVGKVSAIVCIRGCEKEKFAEVCGLLIHEAVHLWQQCKLLLGEAAPSPEFEAYGIQSLAQELIHSYLEQTKEKP